MVFYYQKLRGHLIGPNKAAFLTQTAMLNHKNVTVLTTLGLR